MRQLDEVRDVEPYKEDYSSQPEEVSFKSFDEEIEFLEAISMLHETIGERAFDAKSIKLYGKVAVADFGKGNRTRVEIIPLKE